MPNLLNNTLRRLREVNRPKESIAAIADEIGVKKSYLSKIERGTLKRTSEEVLDRLLVAYKCSGPMSRVCELLNGMGGGHEDCSYKGVNGEQILSANLVEILQGEANLTSLHQYQPMALGNAMLYQFHWGDRLEAVRVLHSSPLPEDLLSEKDLDIRAITPEALVRSMLDEDHWLNRDEYKFERFLSVLRLHGDRVFVTNRPTVADVDVTFAGSVLVFFSVGIRDHFTVPTTYASKAATRGVLMSSGDTYDVAEKQYGVCFQDRMSPALAVKYVERLRSQMKAVRGLRQTLVREGAAKEKSEGAPTEYDETEQ